MKQHFTFKTLTLLFGTLAAICCTTIATSALVLPDGRIKTCTLPNGTMVREFHVPGPVGSYAGFTQFTPGGATTTWNDAQMQNLANGAAQLAAQVYGPQLTPALQQRGVNLVIEQLAFHECAHARLPTSNEYVANAESIKQMQALGELLPGDLQWLAYFTSSLGAQPPQYGGSGAAFWQGTLQVLAQFPGAPTSLDSAPH